ncbi:MAG: alanyl-tRNA editing protein, partial [Clostridia bacterium]|nr:alanyl-tRNA editing protein [Clostridia bacterium]
VELGKTVECELDWEERFTRMQSHTGEHILSGVVHSSFGYNNIGFHMSDNGVMTVDFDGQLTKGDIEKIERLSNEAVYKNVSVTVSFPNAEELKDLDYRSKLELIDNVRIITIDGVDKCACCAPHVNRTGEIGAIKVISFMPYKKGTRLEMLAGKRAFADYVLLNDANKELMKALSAPRGEVVSAVNNLFEQLNALRQEKAEISKKLAVYEINEAKVEVGNSVYAITEGLSFDDLRASSNILTNEYEVCLLLSKNGNDYNYVLSSKSDVKELCQRLNSEFSGKGGGKGGYAQGKITPVSIDEVIAFLKELLQA